jgi:NADH-quinone oxidoreductase subunit C
MTDSSHSSAAAPQGESGAPPPLTALLQAIFPRSVTGHHRQHGDKTVLIRREGMLEVFRFLKEDPRCDFDLMIDLTAVDHLPRAPRFEVVVHLKSIRLGHRLRVKVPIEEGRAEVDSIAGLWAAANWYERECYDLYGIRFAGHPDLRRLLLYPEFQGHPLRKDYDYHLQQPRVPLRTVRERHDYEMKVRYPPGVEKPDSVS